MTRAAHPSPAADPRSRPRTQPRPGPRISRLRRGVAATALTAALLAVAGCSGGDGAGDGGSDEPLTVVWWGSPERTELTQEAISVFEEESGTAVEGQSVDFGGYFDRLATQFAGGDAPDVFTLGGAYPAEYAQRGALLDLTTVSEHLDLDALDETALENGQVDGAQYGLSTGSNALAMIVNPDLVDEAGVERPDPQTWSWDDFAAFTEEISARTDDDTYGTATTLTHDSIEAFARQQGEQLYTEDGEIGVSEESLAEFFGRAQELTETGAAPGAAMITELEDASVEQTLMGTGRAATMLTWSNSLSTLSTTSGSDLELWPLPGESDTAGVWQQSSQFFSISADTEQPEQAAELLDFLVNSQEAVDILGLDRGVPDNPERRAGLEGQLDADSQEEVEYIDQVASRDTAPRPIGPTGSTDVDSVTSRVTAELLHGRIDPSEAAATWLEEARAAVEQ